MSRLTLKDSVMMFVSDRMDYYKQWMFEEPIFISKRHNEELKRLQKVMHKLITHFVNNYNQFKHLMPVSGQVEQLIEKCQSHEYRIGTYRTDFVYDNQQQVKLIEITCRFALNGVFLGALINRVAEEYYENRDAKYGIQLPYEGIYAHMEDYLRGVGRIYVLKGSDQRNESKIYRSIFERVGLEVIEISYMDVGSHLDRMKEALVVSELGLEEILEIPEPDLDRLLALKIINDFRTVFLVHDKRFFSVIGDEDFQMAALDPSEIEFFRRFYVETYSSSQRLDLWQEAKSDKSRWIIKHRSLGKSQKVFAGIVTEESEWQGLFEDDDIKDMVLQRWIDQKTIPGSIGDKEYHDYVTGTLMFFDDNYFGLGDFRTSSHPVTNKVDHRKATSIILEEEISNEFLNAKNYIA